MYERITDEDPYQVPMRIYPAVHYTMGGLWVDYNLMSTIPGLFVLGEANFSDHGANRLGASALMQGLADGYFVLPLHHRRLPGAAPSSRPVAADHPELKAAEAAVVARTTRLLSIGGKRTPTSFHRELGQIMWEHCGMARSADGLEHALAEIPELREEFWRNVNVPGAGEELNQSLENAGRVADFLELGELMCLDALHREESCGGHFREEHQTADGEAKRDDEHFAYVAAWEYRGDGTAPGSTRNRWSSRTSTWPPGATSERHPSRLAAGGRERGGPLRPLRGARRQPRHVVPRDARRGERGADRAGRRSRSPSTTTAAKASAACAA